MLVETEDEQKSSRVHSTHQLGIVEALLVDEAALERQRRRRQEAAAANPHHPHWVAITSPKVQIANEDKLDKSTNVYKKFTGSSSGPS